MGRELKKENKLISNILDLPREERVRLAREAFGMWADREDIPDAVEYVERLRESWFDRLKNFDNG